MFFVHQEIRDEIALQKSGEAKKAAEAALNGNTIQNSIDGLGNASKSSSNSKSWLWSVVINIALGLVLVGFYYIAKFIINQSDDSRTRWRLSCRIASLSLHKDTPIPIHLHIQTKLVFELHRYFRYSLWLSRSLYVSHHCDESSALSCCCRTHINIL